MTTVDTTEATPFDLYEEPADLAELDGDPVTASTIDEADRAVWVIARIDRDAAELEAVFDRRIKALQERKADALAAFEKRRAWWEQTAEGWMRAHHTETGAKSVKLPSGTLSLRKLPNRIDGTPGDDAPETLVRVKRSWDAQAVKNFTSPSPEPIDETDTHYVHAAVTADGEVIAGLTHLVPKAPSFSVKPAEFTLDGF